MICVAVTYVIKPGHEDDAIALFAKLTVPTRAEPGCRMYLAHRSTSEPAASSCTSNMTTRPPSTPIAPPLTSNSMPRAASSPSSKAAHPNCTLRSGD